MLKYLIRSIDGLYVIRADNWSVGTEGLRFFQKEHVVAWFTTWDFWYVKEEGDEIK